MIKEPTEAKIKKFWQQCGFKLVTPEDECSRQPIYDETCWIAPDGKIHNELPPIEPNYLFRYAVPAVNDMGYQVRTNTYSGEVNRQRGECSWVEIVNVSEIPEKTISSWSSRKIEDALFWAINKVINNDRKE